MKQTPLTKESTQTRTRSADLKVSAGTRGVAIAPPAYGIDIVDSQPIQAMSEPNQDPLSHMQLESDTKLNQLTMVGTHDSGTYAFSRTDRSGFSLGKLLPGAFKCQSCNLAKQEEIGARYFDIRVEKTRGNKWSFFHGLSSSGDAVNDVKELLEGCSNENLHILKMDIKGNVDDFLHEVLINTNIQDRLITKFQAKHLATATLGETVHKGKNIAILLKGGTSVDFSNRTYNYKDEISGQWANKTSAAKTVEFMHAHQASQMSENQLLITKTQMPVRIIGGRSGFGPLSVKKQAIRSTSQIHEGVKSIHYQNIIEMDYLKDDERTKKFLEVASAASQGSR